MVGREEWLVDSRLATSIAREKSWAEMMALIEAWTAQHSGAECEARLMAMGVPCTRYRSVSEAMSSAQVIERGAVAEVEDDAGTYLVPTAPFRMPGLNTAPRRAVPKLGEHTESVLAALAGPNIR